MSSVNVASSLGVMQHDDEENAEVSQGYAPMQPRLLGPHAYAASEGRDLRDVYVVSHQTFIERSTGASELSGPGAYSAVIVRQLRLRAVLDQ